MDTPLNHHRPHVSHRTIHAPSPTAHGETALAHHGIRDLILAYMNALTAGDTQTEVTA